MLTICKGNKSSHCEGNLSLSLSLDDILEKKSAAESCGFQSCNRLKSATFLQFPAISSHLAIFSTCEKLSESGRLFWGLGRDQAIFWLF